MPLLWCSISGHGFGHAAQVVPVLNELGRRHPKLKVHLRTTVPEHFFANRLHIAWELSSQEQDVGCVQQGPLTIDVSATWQAYQQFHDSWDDRLAKECEVITQYNPDLVLSNISYLALEAGSRAGIPAIAFASLSWDHVLDELTDSQRPDHCSIVSHIRDMYKRAELAIRLAPALPLEAFAHRIDVGPVGNVSLDNFTDPLKKLRQKEHESLVLVALGGIPLDSLPFEALNQLTHYRFVLDMPLPAHYSNLLSTSDIDLTFPELLRACDIIVSKPGYGTVIEAVAAGKPLVYVRRYNFPDEGPLVEYAHRYGRACELSRENFFSGAWGESLDAVKMLPPSGEVILNSGVGRAADILSSYFSKS